MTTFQRIRAGSFSQSAVAPLAVFSYLLGTRGRVSRWLAGPMQIGSTLLLAQPEELGGHFHPRRHWRREEKDYRGHFTLQQSQTCQPRDSIFP